MQFFRHDANHNKNFFQNYFDHMNVLAQHSNNAFEAFKTNENIGYILNGMVARLDPFEPLCDAHDFLDEVIGIVVRPIISISFAFYYAGAAIAEIVNALVNKEENSEDVNPKHSIKAKNNATVALYYALFSIAAFVKSVISIITRPLVTAIKGFEEREEDNRFHNDDFGAVQINGSPI